VIPVAMYVALLCPLMCPLQSLDLRFILQVQFLVAILMMERMSQNVSAKCKNQATYMRDMQFHYRTAHILIFGL
jgi:hypothetical protein